jgi:hypothetical protein
MDRGKETEMGTGAKLSKDGGTPESMPGFEGRYLEVDGTTIGFESFEQAGDFTPMYKGLPDDRCQSHHWGYVIEGRMIMHRPEGDVVAEQGEAYYVGPENRRSSLALSRFARYVVWENTFFLSC